MSFGNVSTERKAIEMTYEDEADIFRSVSTKDEHKISRKAWVTVYEKITCALSHGSNSSSLQKAQAVDHSHTLFAAPELDIRPGDRVNVTSYGRISEFEVLGKPDIFATHQEVNLKERDLA